jgi:site-specific DNA-methyltransferase (adenine-specific)
MIFCPSVSTQAFVARRNGKVFITGNSGFPKSHPIGKATDKAQGVDRKVVGEHHITGQALGANKGLGKSSGDTEFKTSWSVTKGDSEWEGYGSALKPAWEPVIVAQVPKDGTYANNVLIHDVGGLNIDGCRIPSGGDDLNGGAYRGSHNEKEEDASSFLTGKVSKEYTPPQGRWPANFIHDGSEEVMEVFNKAGTLKSGSGKNVRTKAGDGYAGGIQKAGVAQVVYGDSGSAARFFYCAKASKSERNEGLKTGYKNNHLCVKPIALIEYLATLVLPPERKGGEEPRRVLVPYSGSGSEIIGCLKAGWDSVEGIEIEPEYIQIAEQRINYFLTGEVIEDYNEESDVEVQEQKVNLGILDLFKGPEESDND